MDDKTLQKRLAELRSKTLRQTNNSEQEIRKLYKDLLKDLQGFLGGEYAKLAKDGKISYSILQQKGEYARFLEEVTKRIDGVSPEIVKEIQDIVPKIYELNYKGMVDAVSTAKDVEDLSKELESVKSAMPEVVKANVNNPIDKLTLSDTLEHNRAEITYNIRKQIGIGLVNGDRYEEMAKRISGCLDSNYMKSIRIVRTEAHRVREQGLNDSAVECSNAINRGNSGLVMVKIWRTAKDSRVRPSRGKGKKPSNSSANHQLMEGVTVLADEEFELPSGAVTMSPGSSGVASEDINCRCYCSYKLMTAAEYEKATGKKYKKSNEQK